MKQLPDTALLERMQVADDKAAFDELYHRHWQRLFEAAWLLLGEEADAKDCLQEVFVAFWHKRKELSIRLSVDAYLFGALKYRVLNLFRSRNNYQKHLDLLAAIPPQHLQAADEHLAIQEIQTIVHHTIAAMPEKMREIYLLSRQQQLRIADMAAQLGLSEQTVKNQLSSALKRLKEKLAQYK